MCGGKMDCHCLRLHKNMRAPCAHPTVQESNEVIASDQLADARRSRLGEPLHL